MQEELCNVLYNKEKRKTAKVETAVDVDDKTYTIDVMTEFVKEEIRRNHKINLYDIGLSEEELKRRKNKKYELRKH